VLITLCSYLHKELISGVVLKAFVVAIYTEFEITLASEKMPEQDVVFFGIPEGNKVFMKVRKII